VIFEAGVDLRHAAYRRRLFRTRRLGRPVVCVGNLSMGGTGKTPLVILMARALLAAGHLPSILTRGYGRRGGRDLIVLPPGAGRAADPRETGDEPAVLARALPDVPIIISPDRFRAGRIAEERFPVTVHLLDDGFQHLALHRDLDIVLLDVTRDLAVFPAGRLREPLSALHRAHWVVLTRTELGDGAAFEDRVRAINPHARIFRSATQFAGLIDLRTSLAEPGEKLRGKKVGAFCGIGNPAAFFADLRRWGFSVAMETAFRDHHAYGRDEFDRIFRASLRAGAEAVVTTQKDVMNLPEEWNAPLPFFACCAHPAVEEEGRFTEALLEALLVEVDVAKRTL
jgi:tetraacyldisaccharide 4'-kinase